LRQSLHLLRISKKPENVADKQIFVETRSVSIIRWKAFTQVGGVFVRLRIKAVKEGSVVAASCHDHQRK